jgi:hypothetical protein
MSDFNSFRKKTNAFHYINCRLGNKLIKLIIIVIIVKCLFFCFVSAVRFHNSIVFYLFPWKAGTQSVNNFKCIFFSTVFLILKKDKIS